LHEKITNEKAESIDLTFKPSTLFFQAAFFTYQQNNHDGGKGQARLKKRSRKRDKQQQQLRFGVMFDIS
jgi:hypothetical protein